MEIVVGYTARILFQEKLKKKLYQFNRNYELRSVVYKNDPIELPESEKKSDTDS